MLLRIALYQMNIGFEDKEGNFAKVREAAEKAAYERADVLFLPEMSFTGFSMNTELTAESDNSSMSFVRNLCLSFGLAIGFGWVRKLKDKAENCYSVIDRNGDELSTYVKTHPFSYSGEDRYFSGGSSIAFYAVENEGFSTAVCYDMRFPELFSCICKDERVKAVVIPANWPAGRSEHWKILTRARAIENQVYIIAVNCVGEINGLYYSGDSCVIAPDGEILVCSGNREELTFAEIDGSIADKLRKSFPVKNDRRTDLYKCLL